MRRRRAFPAVLLLAVAVLAAAGCIPTDPDAVATGGASNDPADKLVVGTTSDIKSFNPLFTTSRTDQWLLHLMYPSMMEIDEEGKKTPYLARETHFEDGGRTAVVELRDDFTWSDGTPLTAEDVAFTANAAKEEKIGLTGGMVADMVRAEAATPTRVEFHLSKPYVGFLTNIGFWMPIVPKHVWEKAPSVGDYANNDGTWVGAGPYTLTSYERGQRYTLERVDSYPFAPGGKPAMKTVEFRVFPDVNTLLLALRRGDIGVSAVPIPVSAVEQVKAEDHLEVVDIPSMGYAHVTPNAERPPLNRAEVRRALAMVINKQQIIDVVLRGSGQQTTGVVSPVLEQWDDPDLEGYAYNPGRARELLTKAGFKANEQGMFPELNFEMIFDQGDPNVSKWVQIIRDAAAEAGITIRLSGNERTTYLQRSEDRDFDLYAGSWAIMDEPTDYLNLAFHSSSDVINYGNTADPELDAMIEAGRSAPSTEAAASHVHEAERRIEEQAYDTPIYVETFRFAYNSELYEGFVPQPSELLGIINPRSLANVRPTEAASH